jgi:hypothetical protein
VLSVAQAELPSTGIMVVFVIMAGFVNIRNCAQYILHEQEMFEELPTCEEAVHQYLHEMTAVEIIYLFITERRYQATCICMIESHIDIVYCVSRTPGNPFTACPLFLPLLLLLWGEYLLHSYNMTRYTSLLVRYNIFT